MPKTVQVIARNGSIAKFTVPDGTRKEIEAAIETKLRTDKEIVWKDDSGGVTATCIYEDKAPWSPRRRFFPNGEPDSEPESDGGDNE
jgi:hypothetical protein